jgi:hypothetical protein
MGGTGAQCTQTRPSATSPFRPLSRQLHLVLQAEQQRPAFDEVRPPRHARRSAEWFECSHHNVSILGQVLIVWTRALVFFRSNPISADAPQTPRHCRGTVLFVGGLGRDRRGREVMPTARVACRTTAPSSCAAPVALQLAARPSSATHGMAGVWMSSAACCMLHYRMLRVACCMLFISCRMLHAATGASGFRMYVRTRARNVHARRSCLYGCGR